jgi:predicted enzyme related to lactoylglutathione lyase
VIGSFCTSVLRTPDPERAVAFYGPLMGWTAHSAADGHTFVKYGGKTVASIHRIESGKNEWVPHVHVEHIETAVADATQLGAMLVDQHDIEGVARIATMRDLEGARFGLWQVAPQPGADLSLGADLEADMIGFVGSIWWIELMARDPAIGRDFYGRLFGWTVRETSFEPIGLYRVFERPPTQEGGLNQIEPEWNMQPQWSTIVSVEDCDLLYARACDLGGESGHIHTVPNHGRIGGFFDPDHAWLVMRGPVPAAAGAP